MTIRNISIFILLVSIDEKLFAFYSLETFVNNFSSINARDIKILPFNAYHHDKSNKPYFVLLRSLNAKILWISILKFTYFCQGGVYYQNTFRDTLLQFISYD